MRKESRYPIPSLSIVERYSFRAEKITETVRFYGPPLPLLFLFPGCISCGSEKINSHLVTGWMLKCRSFQLKHSPDWYPHAQELLAIITMLSNRLPECLYLIAGSIYTLTNISPFPRTTPLYSLYWRLSI